MSKYLRAHVSKYSLAKALAPGHMSVGPWPWIHGPRAHVLTGLGPIKKMMKMDMIRVAMPPHKLTFGGHEAYGLFCTKMPLEVFPGLLDLKNGSKTLKSSNTFEN